MSTTWINRLPLFAVVAVGSLAFLTGCNDCDDCEKRVSDCGDCGGPVHVEYHPREGRRVEMDAPATFERRQEFVGDRRDVQMDERGIETSVRSDRGSDFENVRRQERLTEIERERILYPERATMLDDEARRLRVEINEFNVKMGSDRRFDDNRQHNINVRDQNFNKDSSLNKDREIHRESSNVRTDTATPGATSDALKTEPAKVDDAAKKESKSGVNATTQTSVAPSASSSTTKPAVETPAAPSPVVNTPSEIKTEQKTDTGATQSEFKSEQKTDVNANKSEFKSENKSESGVNTADPAKSDLPAPAQTQSDSTINTPGANASDVKYDNTPGAVDAQPSSDVKADGTDKPATDAINKND